MPTSNRKSTGKAAPKTGAASAVPADTTQTTTSDTPITVDPTTPPTAPDRERLRALAAQDQAEERAAGQAAQDTAGEQAAAQLGVPVTEGIPAAAAAGGTVEVDPSPVPKITEGVEGQVGAVEEPVGRAAAVPTTDVSRETSATTVTPEPVRDTRDHLQRISEDELPVDLRALRALADTSGADPVTPYPADGVLAPNPLDLLPPVGTVWDWSREGDTTATARVLADGWRALVNKQYQFARRGDRVTAPADVLRQAAKHGIVAIEE